MKISLNLKIRVKNFLERKIRIVWKKGSPKKCSNNDEIFLYLKYNNIIIFIYAFRCHSLCQDMGFEYCGKIFEWWRFLWFIVCHHKALLAKRTVILVWENWVCRVYWFLNSLAISFKVLIFLLVVTDHYLPFPLF